MAKTALQYTLSVKLGSFKKGDEIVYVGRDGAVQHDTVAKYLRAQGRVQLRSSLATVDAFYCLPAFALAHPLLVDQLVAYRMDAKRREHEYEAQQRQTAWIAYKALVHQRLDNYTVDRMEEHRFVYGPRAADGRIRRLIELDLRPEWNGLPRAHTISWSAIGSVTPNEARKFAEALLGAVEAADDYVRESEAVILTTFPDLKEAV